MSMRGVDSKCNIDRDTDKLRWQSPSRLGSRGRKRGCTGECLADGIDLINIPE